MNVHTIIKSEVAEAQIGESLDYLEGRVAFVTPDQAKAVVEMETLPCGYLRTLAQEHGRNPIIDLALQWLVENPEVSLEDWGAVNAPGTFGDWFFMPTPALMCALKTHDDVDPPTGSWWRAGGPKGLITVYIGCQFLVHTRRTRIVQRPGIWRNYGGFPVQYPSSRRPSEYNDWTLTAVESEIESVETVQ